VNGVPKIVAERQRLSIYAQTLKTYIWDTTLEVVSKPISNYEKYVDLMTIDIDKFQEIYSTIQKNKLRALLTGFSVAWGIYMLIILLGSGTGIENGVNNQFKDATNSIWVRRGQTSLPYKGLQPGRRIQFTNEDYQDVKSTINGIEYITSRFYLWGNNKITYKNEYGAFNIISCHPDHQYLENTILVKGRLINQIDIDDVRKVAAIGTEVEEIMFKNESSLGKYININGIPFKVVGVFSDDEDRHLSLIYLPISTAQKVFNASNRIHAFMFTTGNASVQESLEMEDQVRKKLAARHDFSLEDEKAVNIWNNVKFYQKFVNLFRGIRGIVGVSNIMLIAVKERTREIGIRKALGATPLSIVGLILTEAVIITSVSGYIGLVLGVGTIELASNYLPSIEFFQNPEVNIQAAIGAIVLLVISGSLAGFIPARKAANIKPIEALMEE
jgi:putative ABC transport system permease protein